MNKDNIKSFSKYIFLLLASFSTLFIFSTSTSPLYENYVAEDSAIFITIGKMLKNGNILYKDIFDHKGPIFFFIEYLGQLICEDRMGIFILQIISCYCGLTLFYKILLFYTKPKKATLLSISYLLILSCFLDRGNLTEEFSLPFLMLCFYIVIKWINSKELFGKKVNIYSFIFGICFGIISLMRINNAALIIGLVISVFIIFIQNKRKIQEILKLILFGFLGIIIVYLPVCVYFIKNNCLYEIIYATFIHNFLYVFSKVDKTTSFFKLLLLNSSIILLLLLNIKKLKENHNLMIVTVVSTACLYFTLLVGYGFTHYYMIAVPIISFLISYFIINFKYKINIFIKFVMGYIIILYILKVAFISVGTLDYIYQLNYADYKLWIEKNISEEDRESILAYNISSVPFYYYAEIEPCYKYAFLQTYLFKSNKEIEKEFIDTLKSGKIKYIVMRNLDEIQKNDVDNFIIENYEKIDSLNTFLISDKLVEMEIDLYKLKNL